MENGEMHSVLDKIAFSKEEVKVILRPVQNPPLSAVFLPI